MASGASAGPWPGWTTATSSSTSPSATSTRSPASTPWPAISPPGPAATSRSPPPSRSPGCEPTKPRPGIARHWHDLDDLVSRFSDLLGAPLNVVDPTSEVLASAGEDRDALHRLFREERCREALRATARSGHPVRFEEGG